MAGTAPTLTILDCKESFSFQEPVKKINDGQDVSIFHASKAYRDVSIFLMQLNRSMFPSKTPNDESHKPAIAVYESNSSSLQFSSVVLALQHLLRDLGSIIEEVPLDAGPRRFGNISFRKWCVLLEDRASALIKQHLPDAVTSFRHESQDDAVTELRAYLIGSFGSAQRLDYGTGHELSFLAFLGGIWKLGGFDTSNAKDEERGIVLGVIQPCDSHLLVAIKLDVHADK